LHQEIKFGSSLKALEIDASVRRTCVRSLSTGKERDAETGLDYFGARYVSSAQGRFTSPDAPFADQHVEDPQSWNLYAYVRNNPLRYVDPTGNAIELTGDEEERKKALAAIQAALGNSKASANLYINPELDKKGNQTGRFFVGINGDAGAFAKAGGLEAGLAEVIGAKSIVQFGFGTEVTPKQTFMEALLGPGTQDVGGAFGGAVTLRADATLSGRIQTVVDPTDIRGRLSEAPTPTLGETVAHELIGHALGFVRNPAIGGARTNRMAVDAENAARARGGAGSFCGCTLPTWQPGHTSLRCKLSCATVTLTAPVKSEAGVRPCPGFFSGGGVGSGALCSGFGVTAAVFSLDRRCSRYCASACSAVFTFSLSSFSIGRSQAWSRI
jgi:RHS repeat-associated protein